MYERLSPHLTELYEVTRRRFVRPPGGARRTCGVLRSAGGGDGTLRARGGPGVAGSASIYLIARCY
jgi:hypothetical protein